MEFELIQFHMELAKKVFNPCKIISELLTKRLEGK